jgi:hypothetical protein
MCKRASLCAIAFAISLAPSAAQAQNTPLSSVLLRLLLSDVILAQPSQPGFPDHSAHFVALNPDGTLAPGVQEADVRIPLALNSTIASQLQTFPIPSSSGGFTWTFDPTLGTFNRGTASFGPSFAERAETSGRGRWNVGMSYVRASYDRFEGQSLRNGEVKIYLEHEQSRNPATPSPFYEGDVIQQSLSLSVTTDTAAFAVNYGATDRLDIGIAVPVVRVSLDATVVATIQRLATGSLPQIHQFADGSSERVFSDGGTASGIGDVVLRGKYNFLRRREVGISGAVSVRLPTGNRDDLLGSGVTQVGGYLIVSSQIGRTSPHFNIGYVGVSGGRPDSLYLSRLPNELTYAAGLDSAVTPRLTLFGDVIGRSLRDAGRLVSADRVFNYVNQAGVPGSMTLPSYEYSNGSLGVALAALGGKYNVYGNMLVSAQVLLPLTDSGLRTRPTIVIGADYAF